MNIGSVSKWNEHYNEDMTEQAIRGKYPAANYRVSCFSYPAGTKFPAAMNKGICLVVKGKCRYSFDNFVVELQAGEFAELPRGSYVLTVAEDEELNILIAWKLSDLR